MKWPVLVLTASVLTAAACSSAAPNQPANSQPGDTITVFAASSLKQAFTTLGASFETQHPGARVVLNFGPSSGLATQIEQGAPADVFASASQKTMSTVTASGLAPKPVLFAANTMEIALPARTPSSITSLADLAEPEVTVAVCQKAVPCGSAAEQLFAKNGLTVTPVTEEVDVKAVLTKVALGEVDAGIVYVTDVKSAKGSVVGVSIPAASNVSTSYPIAVLSNSAHRTTAQAFADYVASPEGTKVLLSLGFTSP